MAGEWSETLLVALCPDDTLAVAIPHCCTSSAPLTPGTLIALRNKGILIVVMKSDYQIAKILHVTRTFEEVERTYP